MNILYIIGLLMVGSVFGFIVACLLRASSDNCDADTKKKCPAVIGRDADIRAQAEEIATLKKANASLRGINRKLYDQQHRQLIQARV